MWSAQLRKALHASVFVCMPWMCTAHGEDVASLKELRTLEYEHENDVKEALLGISWLYFADIHVKNQTPTKFSFEDRLTDYLRLRLKNDLSKVEFCDLLHSPKKYTCLNEKSLSRNLKTGGIFHCRVWLSGPKDVFAYHVKCGIGRFPGSDIISSEVMWISDATNIEQSLKEQIAIAVETLAIEFYKKRGEL